MDYKINAEDRRNYFIYLLFMFLLATAFIGWLLMNDLVKINITKTKDEFTSHIEEETQYRKEVEMKLPAIDSLFNKIVNYNPGVNALYAENEITEQIRQLKMLGEKYEDSRYRSFIYLSDLYMEYFNSKKDMGNLQKGINDLNKSLQGGGN